MIKQFISNLLNKTRRVTRANEALPNDQNYILITLDSNEKYEPYIKLHFIDLSDNAREKFTEALYHLNNGEYHQSFINLMLEMSHQDEEIRKFVQSSIIYWGYLIKQLGINNTTTSEINKPLISPTDFNKNAKQ